MPGPTTAIPMRVALPRCSVESIAACLPAADDLAATLTAGIAGGDGAAVECFYRRYFDLLYREARRATGRDEAFSLDVVQETVLRVLRSIRPVASEAQLAAWLRLVVRTTAYDLLRSESRRRMREAAAAPLEADPMPDEETANQLEWLRHQIESLDPQLIHIIELRFRDGWRLARIARTLGLSIGTIDGRLRRALKRLRDVAKEELHA
jgi:RNA polymerase sigma factor (sigma-70 family)